MRLSHGNLVVIKHRKRQCKRSIVCLRPANICNKHLITAHDHTPLNSTLVATFLRLVASTPMAVLLYAITLHMDGNDIFQAKQRRINICNDLWRKKIHIRSTRIARCIVAQII